MRVLELTNSFYLGGSETQAVRLIRYLSSLGVDVAVACLQRRGPLLGELLALGLDPTEFNFQSFFRPEFIRQVIRLAGHIRRLRVKLVHTHDFYTNLLGVPAARLAGVRAVIASRREMGDLKTPAQCFAQRVAYGMATRVLANSEVLGRILVKRERVPASKVVVCPNGVDLIRFDVPGRRPSAIAEGGHAVIMVANFYPEKDHDTFLAAARLVLSEVPDTIFLLVGGGPRLEPLEAAARTLGLDGRVKFLGVREDVPSLLASASVGVLTSFSEGLSNVVLEYMAAGKPAVVTEVGGMAEVVREGETGYVVPPGDPKRLAERVVYLLQNPSEAKRMGAQGRRLIKERFSAEVSFGRIADLYRELLGEWRPVGNT